MRKLWDAEWRGARCIAGVTGGRRHGESVDGYVETNRMTRPRERPRVSQPRYRPTRRDFRTLPASLRIAGQAFFFSMCVQSGVDDPKIVVKCLQLFPAAPPNYAVCLSDATYPWVHKVHARKLGKRNVSHGGGEAASDTYCAYATRHAKTGFSVCCSRKKCECRRCSPAPFFSLFIYSHIPGTVQYK